MTPVTVPKSLKHPHLSELAEHAASIAEVAVQYQSELSPSQLRWKPDAESWSIAECFDHLISTGYLYYPRIEDALEQASADNVSRPYEPSTLAKLFIWTISPDAGLKVTAFQPFEPKHPGEDVMILEMFQDQQSELMDLIERADAVDINSGKFTSPGLVRLTVGEGLTMVVQHERRHMLQVERLLDDKSFPK